MYTNLGALVIYNAMSHHYFYYSNFVSFGKVCAFACMSNYYHFCIHVVVGISIKNLASIHQYFSSLVSRPHLSVSGLAVMR